MLRGFSRALCAAGATLPCASAVCKDEPTPTPNWTDSFLTRVEALAVLFHRGGGNCKSIRSGIPRRTSAS